MKRIVVPLVCLVFSLSSAVGDFSSSQVGNVVKLLETMLAKSKQDGDSDREIYAKYKCYCDNQKETKSREINDLSTEIEVLQNQIEGLRNSNGELSTQVAELKTAIDDKDRQIGVAKHLQGERETAWNELKADLSYSISAMGQAITVLSEVGADQTHSVAADHTQYMAGFKANSLRSGSLLRIQSDVKKALVAAQAFLPADKQDHVQSFLQAPFTGTYTSQSAEVMGILKNMRDTFQANYATAETTFNQQTTAHNALIVTLTGARDEMEKSMKIKQETLGMNDGLLATKKGGLSDAQGSKQAKTEFLDELIPTCDRKAREFEERNKLRANEDAAITQAIAILNKDASFHSFQKVDATSFTQLSSVHRHGQSQRESEAIAKRAERFVLGAAASSPSRSMSLRKIAALIDAQNPFETVLKSIEDMVALIKSEAASDVETWKWCEKERSEANAAVDEKQQQIIALTNKITTLTADIEAPDVGLLAMISKTETDLDDCMSNQKIETDDRAKANLVYQQTIADQVEAQNLLKSAIKVLSQYYSQFSLLQQEPEQVQDGPWENGYVGQSDAGKDVLAQLDFILTNTHKEEVASHEEEQREQHAFEDLMYNLKSNEEDLRGSLARLQLSLADTQKELGETKTDLKKTQDGLAAVQKYLLEIKPGCDFIIHNIDMRDAHRAAELKGLNGAKDQLEGSPAYMTYTAEAHLESQGACANVCTQYGNKQVQCKACLADVTIPAYCAGHAGTPGC